MRIQPAGQYVQLDLTGDSGASFPAHPSDGQLFYRTDSRILYEYDVTSTHWLSLDRKYVPFTGTRVLNATTTAGVYGWLPIFEDVYVESWATLLRLSPTNDGSNYWLVNFFKEDAALADTLITSFNTTADSPSTQVVHDINVSSVFAAASFKSFGLSTSKTGSPTQIDLSSVIVVRSVG